MRTRLPSRKTARDSSSIIYFAGRYKNTFLIGSAGTILMLSKDTVEQELRKIQDPELRLDIVTLGLVYSIDITEDDSVKVRMTLTSPGCPYAPALIQAVKDSCKDLGAAEAEVEITFDPPWEPPEEVRWELGGF